jgi:RNA polymerase sigma-70 factor (ECF subfamily)
VSTPPDGGDADRELAEACARGEREAIQRLETDYIARTASAIGRIDPSATFRDDVLQELRARLLVGRDGKPPKIASYEGRGSLLGWIRVVAVRTALTLKRRAKPPAEDDAIAPEIAPEDPELDHIRAAHAPEFEEAFRAAMASLSVKERNVLRLRYLDGVNIDGIGRMYGTHRATAARWISTACDKLLGETRRLLVERFGVASSQVDSLMRLLQSEFEMSLSMLVSDPNRTP